MAATKDFKAIRRAAEAQGWTVTTRRNGHLAWLPPTGGMPIWSSATPSDSRAVAAHLSLLRRAGFQG